MKKCMLSVLLSVAVLCSALPLALSTSATGYTATEVTEESNVEKIIAPSVNVLTKAKAVTNTKGDGGTSANGWKDTSTLVATNSVSAVAYDGTIAPTGDTWRVRDGYAGEIWLQYDFGTEYTFDSLFLAGSASGKYGIYGVDVYVGDDTYTALQTGTVPTVYSTDDIIVNGRHVQFEAVTGRYLVFRFGGCTANIDSGNVGKIWISELAVTGKEAYPNVVTEVTADSHTDKIIASADNVLGKASAVTWTKGAGDTADNGWTHQYTVTVTDTVPAQTYDGVISSAFVSEEQWRPADMVTKEVWVQYDFGDEYVFDSLFLAGAADTTWDLGGFGIYGADVFVGNKTFTELQVDDSVWPVYSTSDTIVFGRHIQLGKQASGRYLTLRLGGYNGTWENKGKCWISELGATGHAAYPNVVTDITADANTDKLPLAHQNILKNATNVAHTKAGDVTVPDTTHDGHVSLAAGAATVWAPSNSDTYNVWVQYDFGEDYAIDSVLLAGGGNPDWDNGGLGVYGFDVYVGSVTAADLMEDATAATPVYSTVDTVCYARCVDFGKAMTGRYLVFRLGGFTKTWNVGQCWISELAAIGRAVNASGNISDMADVYVPETGIINPPVVVQQITSSLPATDKALPAVAVMDIDDQLNVLNGDGESFATVDEFCQQYSANVIGAYVVDTAAEVTALTDYLTENGVEDDYVFATEENIALVTAAWEAMPSLRRGIICDNVGDTEAEWAALCAKVFNDTGVTQVLSLAPVSMEAMTYFNLRTLAVWSVAEDVAGVYEAVSAGYHAVMTDDPALVYGVYGDITEPTVSGRPLPAAHRGATMAHGQKDDAKGENTIDAFIQAYEYGCLGVEADLRITKACDPNTCTHGCADHAVCADCQPNIVLHHDWNLDRTTDAETLFGANLTTKDLTMAQLRTLTVDYLVDLQGWTGKLCTFEEALAATEELGLVYFCHINDPETIDIFNKVLAAHPEYVDNCVVLASPDDISGAYNYNAVTAPLPYVFEDTDANQDYMMGETDALKVQKYFRQMMNAYNGNPNFYTLSYANFNSNDNFYYQSAARGFVTYHTITNDDTELNKALLTRNGAVGLLTDTIWCTADWHYAVDIKADAISLAPGKTLNTVHDVLGVDQVIDKASCDFVQLSGPELTWSEEKGGYVAAEDAAGDAVIVYYYEGTAQGDTDAGDATYRIYSKPVTVSVNKTSADTPATFVGGQIRNTNTLTGTTALRFGFDLSCRGVSYANPGVTYDREMKEAEVVINGMEVELVDFGAIVSLSTEVNMTLENVEGIANMKKVQALKLYSVSENAVRYTAVVTNVPVSYNDTPIYARSYITYKDGEEIYTVYGEVVSRTVNQVKNASGLN